MPNYTYTLDIPASNNDPSVDQPTMTINNNSIASLVSVDLYGFNNNSGGYHQQVTFPANVSPGAPLLLSSVSYTQPGTADPSTSQMLFQNSTNTLLLSAIRAFGSIQTVTTNGAVTPANQYNVSSVASSSNGTVYTISLVANSINGTTPIVILNLSNDGVKTWSFSANQLTVTLNTVIGLPKLSFVLLQA